MSKILPKNARALALLFSQELVSNGKNFYHKSENVKELLRKGKAVISEVGNYLKTLEEPLKEMHPSDSEDIKQGWVMFFCDIVKQEKITMSHLVTNYEQWVEWACDFKTN